MLNFLKNGKGEILELLFKDPEKEYYLREIAEILGKESGNVQHYLNSLVKEGILIDERRANLRYFKLNKKYPLYEEIKKIISKTIGVEAKIRELVEVLKDIKYAFIFGSIAKNKEQSMSDIDLMLIGEVDEDFLLKRIDKIEDNLKREVNYHIYSEEEITRKIKAKNDFIVKIFRETKIILKGNLNELG